MKSKSTEIKNRSIFENQVPRKMIGLLLKSDMSPSDLAEKIYGKKNVRSGVLRWLKEFDKMGLIKRTDTSDITGRKKLFRAKLKVLGDFDKEEYAFIRVCIERFWNPVRTDPFKSLADLLLETLIIKRIYKIKEEVNYYNAEKDLEFYKKEKENFWMDGKFRNEFLDRVFKKGEKRFNTKNVSFHINRDFLFVSLLAPETILNKLDGEHRSIGNPLYVALTLLYEDNKEKRNKSNKQNTSNV